MSLDFWGEPVITSNITLHSGELMKKWVLWKDHAPLHHAPGLSECLLTPGMVVPWGISTVDPC